MLYQIGIAFWMMLAGIVSLVVGLTGILFGWNREDEVQGSNGPGEPDSILRVSELPDLHDETRIRAMYSSPRLIGSDRPRLDVRDQLRRLPSDRPTLGQARPALHP